MLPEDVRVRYFDSKFDENTENLIIDANFGKGTSFYFKSKYAFESRSIFQLFVVFIADSENGTRYGENNKFVLAITTPHEKLQKLELDCTLDNVLVSPTQEFKIRGAVGFYFLGTVRTSFNVSYFEIIFVSFPAYFEVKRRYERKSFFI